MRLKYILLFCGMMLGVTAKSQITSASASFSENTEYSNSDKIFVFCTDIITGESLTVNDSTGNGGKLFEWYKYSESTEDFTDFLGTGTVSANAASSELNGLETGGYKALVKNGGTDQEYVAWIYNTTDRSVDLSYTFNDCDGVGIIASPNRQVGVGFNTPLSYFDTKAGKSYVLSDTIKTYLWSSDTEPAVNNLNAPYVVMNDEMPTENTIFSLVVTDRFGCTEENSIDYTAIATKALFSWKTYNYYNEEELNSGSETGSISEAAPVVVQFTNNSKNGQEFTWWFGDSTRNDDADMLTTTDFNEEPIHIYHYTNQETGGKTYEMKLVSESNAGCKDSVTLEVNAKQVEIKFPNVFTPNNDGMNDLFHVDSLGEGPVSVRNFKITIFNRAGQMVHEYNGIMSDWEGWDGKVKNSNRDAVEGTYYFIVEVKGWDNKLYTNKFYGKGSSNNDQGSGEGVGQTSDTSNVKFGYLRLYR